jgi:hypothetical protein
MIPNPFRALSALLPVAIAVTLATPALALDKSGFRQLMVLADEPLADLAVDSVAWLPDGRGLVVGGWEQWPQRPTVRVIPAAGAPVTLERVATPRFALSPAGTEVAYWAVSGGDWVQLALVPVTGGQPRYVGDPRKLTAAMYLAWPSDFTMIALTQPKDTCLAEAINVATGALQPLVQVDGGQWVRLYSWPSADPIAVWADRERKCFRLSALGRPQELGAEWDRDRAAPGGLLVSYFDTAGALWLAGRPKQGPAKIAEDAGAACWSPDASVLLFARRRSLWSVASGDLEQRQVLGSALDSAGLEASAPRGMSWSPSGQWVAYWRQSGGSGQLRRIQLGLEDVAVRVKFAGNVRAKAGERLWIATKLFFDKQGRPTEPVWSTLKAEMTVRSSLPGPKETFIQATNAGASPGVVARLAGAMAETLTPGTTAAVSLKPIPGLIGWLQGTRLAGEVVSLEVTRTPLTMSR